MALPSLEQTPFSLTETDRQVLAQTDDEFVLHDWEDLKNIIARNDLGSLKRKPSDLVRYIKWSTEIKAQYGSVTNYVCQRRLGWESPFTVRNPVPFADPADYKILRNDWPYGVSPGISHLVVWLQTPIPVEEEGGDMTEESRALVEEFVQRTFVTRLNGICPDPVERVLWFKNWTALQSVRALDHVHILVRDVPEEVLLEWTGEPPSKQDMSLPN